MSSTREGPPDNSAEGADRQELIYYCEQHGAMNKLTDLKDKVDQVAKKV